MQPAGSVVLDVELNHLSKSFRVRHARRGGVAARIRDFFDRPTQAVTAIDRLSFSIASGERVAFIGPNGAGKSTTLKVLAGILVPDAGDVRVLGLVPWRERQRLAFHIGTVFGQRSQLWYQLPARDTFELLGRVYEIDNREHRRRIDALTSVFEIGALVDTHRCVICLSASACAARSSPVCSTRRACCFSTSRPSASTCRQRPRYASCCGPVSYTHLTLPTIYSV